MCRVNVDVSGMRQLSNARSCTKQGRVQFQRGLPRAPSGWTTLLSKRAEILSGYKSSSATEAEQIL